MKNIITKLYFCKTKHFVCDLFCDLFFVFWRLIFVVVFCCFLLFFINYIFIFCLVVLGGFFAVLSGLFFLGFVSLFVVVFLGGCGVNMYCVQSTGL